MTLPLDTSVRRLVACMCCTLLWRAAHKMCGAGTMLKCIVRRWLQVLRDQGQARLVEAMGKNIGFGMGLEFRESSNVLSSKNEGIVRAGMVFNVCLGVSGLEAAGETEANKKTYALQVRRWWLQGSVPGSCYLGTLLLLVVLAVRMALALAAAAAALAFYCCMPSM
jgi:hypothetical protein